MNIEWWFGWLLLFDTFYTFFYFVLWVKTGDKWTGIYINSVDRWSVRKRKERLFWKRIRMERFVVWLKKKINVQCQVTKCFWRIEQDRVFNEENAIRIMLVWDAAKFDAGEAVSSQWIDIFMLLVLFFVTPCLVQVVPYANWQIFLPGNIKWKIL